MTKLFLPEIGKTVTLALIGWGVRFAHAIWTMQTAGTDSFQVSAIGGVQLFAILITAFAMARAHVGVTFLLGAVVVSVLAILAPSIATWRSEAPISFANSVAFQTSEMALPIVAMAVVAYLSARLQRSRAAEAPSFASDRSEATSEP